MLALHCYFHKRSPVFLILTGSSRSKIEATVGISEGPLPRWMVDVRISAFQLAFIKYGNIPGKRRACGSISLAKHIHHLLSSWQKTLYLSYCLLLWNARWRTVIGHFTQPAYSSASRVAPFYLLCKCNISTRLLMRLTKGIRWESICCLAFRKMKIFQKKKKETWENWKAPLSCLKVLPYAMKI